MSRNRIQLVILCEDIQQEVFARHFFIQRGFNRHKIRVVKNPKGLGSGEQFVRTQYPREVKTHRRKMGSMALLLAVVIDADINTVQNRLDQLDTILDDSGQEKRRADEEIAIFIPKRNIETWIHYLMGEKVDEETAYPKFSKTRTCKPYVEKLVQKICPRGLPENAPILLHLACDEMARIL